MELPTHPTPGDTVSQSEIEKLLAQAGGAEAPSGEPGTVPAQTPSAGDFLQRHDFPQLSLYSAGELRILRMRHEEFINSLAARLSIRFGMEVVLQMSKLETAPFGTFVESLANPTHLTVLKLEPLQGNCLLDMPLRLGLSLVGRELGGSGVWQDEPRELTKMEAALLSSVVENILNEWCGVWGDLLDLRPVLVGCENNARFLQTCAPNTTMLVLGIELRMGSLLEEMQLGLPYPTLEPLMAKLCAVTEATQKPAPAHQPRPVKWNPMLNDMILRVSAELPDLQVTAGQLAHLKSGDVIPFAADLVNHVQISLEGTPRFTAVLGRDNEHRAAKILKLSAS
jgi:flagellar motor switch protein FliM